jgi:hypothetical protein
LGTDGGFASQRFICGYSKSVFLINSDGENRQFHQVKNGYVAGLNF